MNAHQIQFSSNRFNLTEVGEHFVNLCCFGEDLAEWLGAKLREKGLNVSKPGQEDWGWYLKAKLGNAFYFLAMSGYPTDAEAVKSDLGVWRIIVKKNRTLGQFITGRGKIQPSDEMTMLIEEILREQQDFGNVQRES